MRVANVSPDVATALRQELDMRPIVRGKQLLIRC